MVQDLQYRAVPALFAALSAALRVQPPDELRLLAVGLDRRNDGLRASGVCEDDPRVAEMGYSCAMMEAFCDSKLHDLAAAQKKQLPDWLPKEARVKDACRKTCGVCGRSTIHPKLFSHAKYLFSAGRQQGLPPSGLFFDRSLLCVCDCCRLPFLELFSDWFKVKRSSYGCLCVPLQITVGGSRLS